MNIMIGGCSRGIGRAVVENLLFNPEHKIFGVSRNIDSLEALASDRFRPLAFDLKEIHRYDELLAEARSFFAAPVDVLINNAASIIKKPFVECNSDDFDYIFDLNVKSVFFLIQKLVPHFSKGSHIVNIGSMSGFQGSEKYSGLALYSASKAAIATLTESLAVELRPLDISVNALALGAVQTEMLNEAFPGYTAPLDSNTMAEYIVDFATKAHRVMNGKIVPVSLSNP